MPSAEIERVKENVKITQNFFSNLLISLPSFQVTTSAALPYGLKPHTRSVSWLVEQVLVQKAKQAKSELGASDVTYDLPDTELHDLEVTIGSTKLYINVKCHQADKRPNKNDISAVVKLYNRYVSNPNYELIYAAIGIRFEGLNIVFLPDHVHCFSPQFLPLYVNPTNDKIQAFYNHIPVYRSRNAFISELKASSKEIKL